jgi:hypothetical protein
MRNIHTLARRIQCFKWLSRRNCEKITVVPYFNPYLHPGDRVTSGQGVRRRCAVWNYVIAHFDSFLKELELSPDDRKDADRKAERIARSLFAKYYPNKLIFDPSCYVKVGSYGKDCGSSNHSDLDMLFILPWDVYNRINAVSGNGQSQLLQELKAPLTPTQQVHSDSGRQAEVERRREAARVYRR